MSHGKGSYYHASTGAIYEGNWVADKQEGFGIEQWPDGTTYTGDFHHGMKHGQGILTTFNAKGEIQRYEGRFI